MKLLDRIKPKNKNGIINYVILLLVVVEIIFTFLPSIHFVAEDRRFDPETKKPISNDVEISTSLQNYLWFPASGNDKLNDKLTEQLIEDHFEGTKPSDHEKTSYINGVTLFPILFVVVTIALLIVCIAFAGNLAATLLSVLWGIVGCLACFVNNSLFKFQSTYTVQMVLILLATVLAIGNTVLTFLPKAKKESNNNKIVA